jgi:hypothetical protein
LHSNKTLAKIFAEHGDYDQAFASVSTAIELATIAYGADGGAILPLIDFQAQMDAARRKPS